MYIYIIIYIYISDIELTVLSSVCAANGGWIYTTLATTSDGKCVRTEIEEKVFS